MTDYDDEGYCRYCLAHDSHKDYKGIQQHDYRLHPGVLGNALRSKLAVPPPKRIDYDRMNAVFPSQKAALTRASKGKDPEAMAKLIKGHIAIWEEIGAWPDAWATWQNALDDMLPLSQHVDIRDL